VSPLTKQQKPSDEKRRTNPAKRASLLQRELERRREKLAAVEAEITELERGQQEAVAETLREDPTRSAFERGKAPSERERKSAELEKAAGHLRAEILALEGEAAAAAAELAERRLGEAILQTKKVVDEERDVIGQVGDLLLGLAKHWNRRAGLLNDRRAIAERVRADGLVQTLGATRPDLVEAWEEEAASTLAPAALSFSDFVATLISAALAERPDLEAERATVDELNRRRREHARRDPGGNDDLPPIPRPVIRVEPLFELVPDLRDEVAKFDSTIAGEPLPRSSEPQVEGLAEAGFGLSGEPGYTSDGNLRLSWRRSPSPEAA
jgi:hypothetical protein